LYTNAASSAGWSEPPSGISRAFLGHLGQKVCSCATRKTGRERILGPGDESGAAAQAARGGVRTFRVLPWGNRFLAIAALAAVTSGVLPLSAAEAAEDSDGPPSTGERAIVEYLTEITTRGGVLAASSQFRREGGVWRASPVTLRELAPGALAGIDAKGRQRLSRKLGAPVAAPGALRLIDYLGPSGRAHAQISLYEVAINLSGIRSPPGQPPGDDYVHIVYGIDGGVHHRYRLNDILPRADLRTFYARIPPPLRQAVFRSLGAPRRRH
jgi:hypothetical protein